MAYYIELELRSFMTFKLKSAHKAILVFVCVLLANILSHVHPVSLRYFESCDPLCDCAYCQLIGVTCDIRQNLIENRAILGFSGQKSGTKMIISFYSHFIHFRIAKYINNCRR